MKEKGVISPVILAVGLILVILAGGYYFKNIVNNDQNIEVSEQNIQPNIEQTITTVPSLTPAVSTTKNNQTIPAFSCNSQKDICFEKNEYTLDVQEGYLEYKNFWVTDQIKIVGQGKTGFELKSYNFSKEVIVATPADHFDNEGNINLYLGVQKDVTKKGVYTGEISIRSYLTGTTQRVKITLNYVDWDPASVHAVPAKVEYNCTITNGESVLKQLNLYINCGNYNDISRLQIYSRGENKSIELRSVPDEGSKRFLNITYQYDGTSNQYNATTKDFRDIATVKIDLGGFPRNPELIYEPDGLYKGNFLFIDQTTQKEILKVPYTLKVNKYKQ